jgi:RNA-directed DNA polymerase
MSQLAALKSAASRNDVAKLLATSLKGMTSILHTTPIANRYTEFQIPKKGGGSRTIKAPDEKLKLLQKKLSILLQDCLDEINAAKNIKGTIAHGFMRHRNIVSNAERHHHRRWVFNIDLKDFFPSINFGRVRGFFIKDKNFALQPHVATVLAQIACDGAALPQGSPCSPVISNLVAHVLDIHIVRLAAEVGCTYSRYADDLTFSTSKQEFPAEIARPTAAPHSWVIGERLQEIITHSGFTVNHGKTRMQYLDSRQEVTGLVVNRKVNIRREYRHSTRAMVHRLFNTGKFQILGPITKDGVTTFQMRDGSLDELQGRLGFVDSIDVYNKKKVGKGKGTVSFSRKELMYRQFIIYRDFYIAKTPVVLCEGKTDGVYLKHAIRSLVDHYPELAGTDDKGKVKLKIRIYRYTKSSTTRILGLQDGGSGQLPKFIGNYKHETDKFRAPGLDHPFIILFDNDSGATPVINAIKDAIPGKKKFCAVPYTHVIKNLYAVPTPPIGNKTATKIEDFFDASTLAHKLGNKTFTDQNDFDSALYYGKKDFAEEVVAKHAKTINFSGFKPLLDNITAVIREHAQKVAPAAAGEP